MYNKNQEIITVGWAYIGPVGPMVNVQVSSFNVWRAPNRVDPIDWCSPSRPIDFTIPFHFYVEHSNFEFHCPPKSQVLHSRFEFRCSDLSILLSVETGCDYKLKHVSRQTR